MCSESCEVQDCLFIINLSFTYNHSINYDIEGKMS